MDARVASDAGGASCYNLLPMPKLLTLIILFLAITLVIFSFSELQDVVNTLERADAGFVVLAVSNRCIQSWD